MMSTIDPPFLRTQVWAVSSFKTRRLSPAAHLPRVSPFLSVLGDLHNTGLALKSPRTIAGPDRIYHGPNLAQHEIELSEALVWVRCTLQSRRFPNIVRPRIRQPSPPETGPSNQRFARR